MEYTKIGVAIVVLLLVAGGMFTYTHLKKQELADPTVPAAQDEDRIQDPYASIVRIDGKHFYDGQTHTIVGEVLMPTMCDLLSWDTRIQESMPETAVIDFRVVNESEVCAQAAAPQRFQVSFDASETATIRATFQGRPIELNLVPAGPEEDPDDFELFIKG